MVFGWIQSKVEGGKSWMDETSARLGSKEDAEAIVAVMTGVAFSDGELEEAEKQKLFKSFGAHPVLSKHSSMDLGKKYKEIISAYDIDIEVGKAAVRKEFQDVLSKMGSSPDRERALGILRMGVAAARSDGEIEATERDFISELATMAGIQPKELGL